MTPLLAKSSHELPKPSRAERLVQDLNALREDRDGVPLGLEERLLDVPEVFAVRVQRERDVTVNLYPVEVVLTEEPAIVSVAAQDACCH